MSSTEKEIQNMIKILESEGRFANTKLYHQHGTKSVYDHCVEVTRLSMRLAEKLHLKVDRTSLMRGALLHDYFLYDWHEKDSSHSLHGFFHAGTALRCAREDFELTELEIDIISHHMFPLNFRPPHHKEAWIVCIADKICAGHETLAPYLHSTQ